VFSVNTQTLPAFLVKNTFVGFEVFHGGDYEECHFLGCDIIWVFNNNNNNNNNNKPTW
jgi:hypothetical protein